VGECKDCKWWGQQRSSRVGVCRLMSSTPLLGVERRAQAIADHQNDSASVLTLSDFGCADFAEKPLDETVAE